MFILIVFYFDYTYYVNVFKDVVQKYINLPNRLILSLRIFKIIELCSKIEHIFYYIFQIYVKKFVKEFFLI